MSNQTKKNNVLCSIDSLKSSPEEKMNVKLSVENLVNNLETRLEIAIKLLHTFSGIGLSEIEYIIRDGAKKREAFDEFISSNTCSPTDSEIGPLRGLLLKLWNEYDSLDY